MNVTRRQALVVLASAGVLGPFSLWLSSRSGTTRRDEMFPVHKSDADWRSTLPPERYRILRGHNTERPFSSSLNHEKRVGTFACAACGQPVFSSKTKFESGTGWPSFWEPIEGAVGTEVDTSYFMVRTEVHCARCGGHLGHVFNDGPDPTGLRYCINGLSLQFTQAK
jgi:peptide-methionine (R)-S-oxide reductase